MNEKLKNMTIHIINDIFRKAPEHFRYYINQYLEEIYEILLKFQPMQISWFVENVIYLGQETIWNDQ